MTKEEIMNFDSEALLNPDNVLKALSESTSLIDQQVLINAFMMKSREYRCARQMQALIKSVKEEAKDTLKNVNVSTNNVTDFGYISGELNCGSWIADNNGVRILSYFGEKIACYHPILPIERLCNIETKTEKITLAYKRGNWKEITVDKGLIASASKIVKLADYGIAVTSETAKDLVKYLADVENLNEIPTKNSTSKFGWHNNYQGFIPYDEDVIFDDGSRFKDLRESLESRGSFDIWLDLVRKIRANKVHYEPQLCMSACFASVLISKTKMLPCVINLWGSSGKGKTVVLMLCCSIYADPTEGKYITDSYSTQNAFEIRLDILNHLPLLMDDMSKVRDKLNDDFTDLIYLLCSGKGKDRSNIDLGLNKVKTWSNTIITNMERPLATETMKGGAINRILDFEMQEGYIFEDGNHVVGILQDNYGFAGPKFIDIVKELPKEVIINIRKDFEQKIKEEAKRQGSVKEEKQILPLAILLTADKIATEYIFEDGIYLDIPTLVSQLKDVNEVSEGQRAYDTLKDFVVANKNMFPNEIPAYSAWGFVSEGYINILPTVLRKLATEQNFSVKAFTSWADSKGLLKKNNKNCNNIRVGGDIMRFYSIKISQDADEHGDSGFVDAGNEELPFD